MVDIKYLKINTLATHIQIKVETTPGNIFTKVLIWNKDTFKDYDIAYDVSSYIVGTGNVEIINIPASELGVTEITGMYFVEFETNEVDSDDTNCCDCNSNTSIGVVANLVPYYNCLSDKVLDIDIKSCGDEVHNNCKKSNNEQAYYITSLLQTLNMSILSGYFEDSINILNNLESICEPCHSCPSYGDTDIFCGYGYGILNNTITEQSNCCIPDPDVPVYSGCYMLVDCTPGPMGACFTNSLAGNYIGKVLHYLGQVTESGPTPDKYLKVVEVDTCLDCIEQSDIEFQGLVDDAYEILDDCPFN